MRRSSTKLLMTADAVGGIWTYALDLATALLPQGIATTLAVVGPGLGGGRHAVAVAAGLSVVELGHAPEWLAEGPAAVARGGAALAALARDCDTDILHLNHAAFGSGTRFPCPVLTVGHSCVASWWRAVRGTALPPDLAWQADLVGRGYRSADALAVPSAAFAAVTRALYGLPQLPAIVPNGRAALTSAAPQGAPPRAGVTAGRLWDEGKDLATLDLAAARTDVPLRAYGPVRGPNGASVAAAHLQVCGPVSEGELRAVLAERPVYLSPARYEPFGLAVLEAAQAGCPLVLSDIPTFRELWDGAAQFVAPGDAAGFAAALDALVADPARRDRLGAAARERASRYTLDRAVAAVLRLYEDLLAGAAPADGITRGAGEKAA